MDYKFLEVSIVHETWDMSVHSTHHEDRQIEVEKLVPGFDLFQKLTSHLNITVVSVNDDGIVVRDCHRDYVIPADGEVHALPSHGIENPYLSNENVQPLLRFTNEGGKSMEAYDKLTHEQQLKYSFEVFRQTDRAWYLKDANDETVFLPNTCEYTPYAWVLPIWCQENQAEYFREHFLPECRVTYMPLIDAHVKVLNKPDKALFVGSTLKIMFPYQQFTSKEFNERMEKVR